MMEGKKELREIGLQIVTQ
jgi:hypothetical protein